MFLVDINWTWHVFGLPGSGCWNTQPTPACLLWRSLFPIAFVREGEGSRPGLYLNIGTSSCPSLWWKYALQSVWNSTSQGLIIHFQLFLISFKRETCPPGVPSSSNTEERYRLVSCCFIIRARCAVFQRISAKKAPSFAFSEAFIVYPLASAPLHVSGASTCKEPGW